MGLHDPFIDLVLMDWRVSETVSRLHSTTRQCNREAGAANLSDPGHAGTSDAATGGEVNFDFQFSISDFRLPIAD